MKKPEIDNFCANNAMSFYVNFLPRYTNVFTRKTQHLVAIPKFCLHKTSRDLQIIMGYRLHRKPLQNPISAIISSTGIDFLRRLC